MSVITQLQNEIGVDNVQARVHVRDGQALAIEDFLRREELRRRDHHMFHAINALQGRSTVLVLLLHVLIFPVARGPVVSPRHERPITTAERCLQRLLVAEVSLTQLHPAQVVLSSWAFLEYGFRVIATTLTPLATSACTTAPP